MAEEHSVAGTPRLLLVAEVFTGAVGLPALRRALPIYVGIGIAVAVLFAPNAMSAADVTDAAASRWFRLGLWVSWLAAMATPCRVIIDAANTGYLRALPVPRSYFWVAQLLWLGLLQAPWAWLWLRGVGATAAFSATVLAVAAQVALAARPRHGGELLVKIAIVGAVLAVLGLVPESSGLVGVILLVAIVPLAWSRSAEGSGFGLRFPIAGPAELALALAQGALLWRRQRGALVRAVIVVAIGAAATALAVEANGIAGAGISKVSLAIALLTLLVVVGGLAVAVVERERELRWLLDSSGTSGLARVVGSVVVVAATLGAGHGIAVAWALEVEPLMVLRLAAVALVAGVVLAAIAVAVARYAERVDGVDGTRVVSGLIVLAVAAVLLTGLIGELVVLVLAAVGLGLTVATTEIACSPAQRWGRRR